MLGLPDRIPPIRIPGVRTRESRESRTAAPIGIVAFLILGAMLLFVDPRQLPGPLQTGFFVLALLLVAVVGVALGVVMGEAFAYADGIQKMILGGISSLLAVNVTLDQVRKQLETAQEKILYLLGLIPISDPAWIRGIIWFTLAFTIAFIFSAAIHFTRRREKEVKQARRENA